MAVLVGSGLSGLGAYAFQIIGTRALGKVAYAPVSVLWTIQYLIFAVLLYPAETYVTGVRVAAGGRGAASVATAVRAVLLFAVASAAALGLAAFLARRSIFSTDTAMFAVVTLSALAYGAYVVVRGVLAGAGDYTWYAIATGAESLLRAFLLILVVALGATTTRVAFTLPAGAALATGVALASRCWLPTVAVDASAIVDPAGAGAGRFLASTVVANAAAQTLLAAGPLVAVPLGATAAQISICFVTVTLVRAPLVLGFGGLLARMLPPLARRAQSGDWQGVRRVGLGVLPVALALAGFTALFSALAGPALVGAFFGSAFRPDRLFVALAAAAAVLATANLLSNQILVARRSEARLVLPWLTALLAAAVVLFLPGPRPLTAVALAFLAGELVAAVALAAALLTAPPLGVPDCSIVEVESVG